MLPYASLYALRSIFSSELFSLSLSLSVFAPFCSFSCLSDLFIQQYRLIHLQAILIRPVQQPQPVKTCAHTHTHTHTCLAILVRTRTWHLEGCIQPHYQLKCSHTRHSLNWWSWRCCEDRAGCWADYMTLSSSNGRKSTLSLYFSCVVFSP